MFLIINTTEDKSQVILADNLRFLAQKSFKAHVEHSEKLLPEIEKLLKKKRKLIKNLKAIIIITGPGSFTGCRVGAATANAMSFALNVPVAGISKNEIVNVESTGFNAQKSIKKILKVAQKILKTKKAKFAIPFYAHPPHITKAKPII